MEMTLGDLTGNIGLIYMDEIIISLLSWEKHFHDLEAVLMKVQRSHGDCQYKKVQLLPNHPKISGSHHLCSCSKDEEKIQTVEKHPVPPKLKVVQVVKCVQPLILNFWKVVEPLNALKQEKAKFQRISYIIFPPENHHKRLQFYDSVTLPEQAHWQVISSRRGQRKLCQKVLFLNAFPFVSQHSI